MVRLELSGRLSTLVLRIAMLTLEHGFGVIDSAASVHAKDGPLGSDSIIGECEVALPVARSVLQRELNTGDVHALQN